MPFLLSKKFIHGFPPKFFRFKIPLRDLRVARVVVIVVVAASTILSHRYSAAMSSTRLLYLSVTDGAFLFKSTINDSKATLQNPAVYFREYCLKDSQATGCRSLRIESHKAGVAVFQD